MTKGWRPEGWETLKPKNAVLHCIAPDQCVGTAYEAGADAMLEALRKRSTRRILPEHGYHDDKGFIVFIPDDPPSDDDTELLR